jgi:NADPH-dependent ferric siderophore reductase
MVRAMQRVTLGGGELHGFHSAAPDDHVKLFFPNTAGELVTPTFGPNGPEYPPDHEPSPMREVEILLEIPDARDRQTTSTAHVDVVWLERNGEMPGEKLERALQDLSATPGDTFYWIATESRRARAMRLFLTNERGIPNDWIRATGYWKLGVDRDALRCAQGHC